MPILLRNKKAFFEEWSWTDDAFLNLAYWKYETYVGFINEDRQKKAEEAKKRADEEKKAHQRQQVKAPNLSRLVNNLPKVK